MLNEKSNKFGHSGAKIVVRKEQDCVIKSAQGIGEQAQYMKFLGSSVCPKIFGEPHKNDPNYVMEFLYLYPVEEGSISEKLEEIKSVLQKYVWCRKSYSHDEDWFEQLVEWLKKNSKEDLIDTLDKLYEIPSHPCLIHGDPTVANLMYRMCDHGMEPKIIDPIKPRGKIPSFREVDLGKMLQSALGWEYILGDNRPPVPESIYPVLLDENEETVNKSWFWCVIHLLRILPYAKTRRVIHWANFHIERISNDLIHV